MEKQNRKRFPLVIFTKDESVLKSNLMIRVIDLEQKAEKEMNDQLRKDLLLYQAHELRDILRQL